MQLFRNVSSEESGHKVARAGQKGLKWREGGASKTYWWVISGKCLQDKYQKCNFIGEDCKAK